MIVKRLIVMCVAAAAAAEGMAQAVVSAKMPYYVSASVAATHTDAIDDLGDRPDLYEVSSRATGMRLTVGRHWGPVWATELSYTDYGRAKFRAQDGTGSDAHGWLDMSGFAGWSVWRARTDMDIILVTRIGVAYNRARAVIRQTGFEPIDTAWRNWAFTYGLGMEYDLPERWRLHGAFDATMLKVGDDRPKVMYLGLGLGRTF